MLSVSNVVWYTNIQNEWHVSANDKAKGVMALLKPGPKLTVKVPNSTSLQAVSKLAL